MENNYQLSRIHNYIHGLMSKEEMHALEREALEDPFLQDALDGYKLQNGVDAKSLSLLQQRLEKQVLRHAQEKNRYFFSWQRLAIALVSAVMFIAVCTLLLMPHLPKRGATNITEVELMDEALTRTQVRTMPGADAVPVDGWKAFAAFLSDNYSGKNTERKVEITFKVDQNGGLYDIQSSGIKEGARFDEVKTILTSGPKWKGSQGHIEILFPE